MAAMGHDVKTQIEHNASAFGRIATNPLVARPKQKGGIAAALSDRVMW